MTAELILVREIGDYVIFKRNWKIEKGLKRYAIYFFNNVIDYLYIDDANNLRTAVRICERANGGRVLDVPR
mgnify:CR=1 FL=1